jgi:peroxiredoxin
LADDFADFPDDLPVPVDDGAAAHLTGRPLPALGLPATSGETVNLTELRGQTVVVYVYPQTGVPGRPLPEGWDQVPGARGCTPQSCAFRDLNRELEELGARVFGLSSQQPAEQAEFAQRVQLPYPLLNDGEFELATMLELPTFELEGRRYYRRLTLIVREGRIAKVFYPVFPPQGNAADVAAWLREHPVGSGPPSRPVT